MRDKTHIDQIERWAEFCRSHPAEWKKLQKEFIDAQFKIAERFYEKLRKSKKGKQIILELKKMKISND